MACHFVKDGRLFLVLKTDILTVGMRLFVPPGQYMEIYSICKNLLPNASIDESMVACSWGRAKVSLGPTAPLLNVGKPPILEIHRNQ